MMGMDLLTEEERLYLLTHNNEGEIRFSEEYAKKIARRLLTMCKDCKDQWKETFGDPDEFIEFMNKQGF